MSRWSAVSTTLCLLLLVGHASGAEPVRDEGSPSWWRPVYLADYGSVIASAALLGGLRRIDPSSAAMIGPSFSEDDWEAILDPAYDDEIGYPHTPESVPEVVLAPIAGGGLVGIMVMEWIPGLNGLDEVDGQLVHDAVLGYLEALTWTLALSELFKVTVGRLRPDFQDRAVRYHCGTLGQNDGICAGFVGEPLSAEEYRRGRKSFVSSHASLTFAVASYWNLIIGGRLVWGERASADTRAVGVWMQSALLTGATLVSISRIVDRRHHAGDVAAGAGIGIGLAAAAYFRHFGLDGLPRSRASKEGKAELALGPSAQGLGLGLSGRF
ncbi:MAG: phosphatase PAP2 family protein [Deltaproteobacteria bacterium]|jgi:membrane-associated phospholipid phosphatase|nr:phosphatase PAP2 family protein [Deltaproteobacteria bacterium]MBW2535589.1 phosphatase PAP2 family protein [Deltaproteobacteria bacterium]